MAVAPSGFHCVSAARPTTSGVGSPIGTTSSCGSFSTRVNVNRSTVFQGASSRAQALAAAAGTHAAATSAATTGTAAIAPQSRCRACGTAWRKSYRVDCAAT